MSPLDLGHVVVPFAQVVAEIRDVLLRSLWQELAARNRLLAAWDICAQFDSEIQLLVAEDSDTGREMDGLRVFCGLAIISRFIDRLAPSARLALIDHLSKNVECANSGSLNVARFGSTIFEAQVFGRVALAGMTPVFLQPPGPDILVEDRGIVLECKSLTSHDLRSKSIDGICATLRKRANKAEKQLRNYEFEKGFFGFGVFQLPLCPHGFFRRFNYGARINVALAASASKDTGAGGTPGSVQPLLVESSFTPLYGRFGVPTEPMEYWHTPLGAGHFRSPVASLFIWDLFMSMNVCPFEGYQYPSSQANYYAYGQSEDVKKKMNMRLALEYWRMWQLRTGVPLTVSEVPYLAICPPNRSKD